LAVTKRPNMDERGNPNPAIVEVIIDTPDGGKMTFVLPKQLANLIPAVP